MMFDIVLVRPPLNFSEDSAHLPVGLLSLASYLEQENFSCVIEDFDFQSKMGEIPLNEEYYEIASSRILNYNSRVIGLSAWSCQLPSTIKLAQAIKAKRPDILIVIGGPAVGGCHVPVIESFHDCLDCVIRGEGEVTLNSLMKRVKDRDNWHNTEGIVYWDGSRAVENPPRKLLADMDELPLPAYHLIDVPAYLEKMSDPYLDIVAGSGCPFACVFCSTAEYWERRYRTKSIERILWEMDTLAERYNIKKFNFIHDNFIVNRKYIQEFTSKLKDASRDYLWGCAGRIDQIDEEMTRWMVESGCLTIFFGIESGSQKVQRLIQKNQKVSVFKEKIQYCQEVGMQVQGGLILGFPFEEREDLEDTFNVGIMGSTLGAHFRSYLLSPLPGTNITLSHQNSLQPLPNITFDPLFEESFWEYISQRPNVFSTFFYIKNDQFDRDYLKEIRAIFNFTMSNYPKTTQALVSHLESNYFDLFVDILNELKNIRKEEWQKRIQEYFSKKIATESPDPSSKLYKIYRKEKAMNQLESYDVVI